MDIENRFVVAKGEEGWGGKDWEFGVSRCKLLHVGLRVPWRARRSSQSVLKEINPE